MLKSNILFILMIWGLLAPLFAQEGILKDFAEGKRDRKYAFYPSTLRMINLTKNPDYNEMVNDIEKILVYSLDSATCADKSYLSLSGSYESAGFEEYARMFGGDFQLTLLGKEGRENEFFGLFGQDEAVYVFYLKGTIAWEKVTSLITTLQNNELLNLSDLN